MEEQTYTKDQIVKALSNGLKQVNNDFPVILTDNQKQILHDVYGALWAEACYDPDNESTRKFADPLYEKMKELNKELKFKL